MRLHNEEEIKQDRVGFVFFYAEDGCIEAIHRGFVLAERAQKKQNAPVILGYVFMSVAKCLQKKGGTMIVRRRKKKCRAEISGRRAELCSSVLAPVRNPGRQRKRECRRRGSHIHLV